MNFPDNPEQQCISHTVSVHLVLQLDGFHLVSEVMKKVCVVRSCPHIKKLASRRLSCTSGSSRNPEIRWQIRQLIRHRACLPSLHKSVLRRLHAFPRSSKQILVLHRAFIHTKFNVPNYECILRFVFKNHTEENACKDTSTTDCPTFSLEIWCDLRPRMTPYSQDISPGSMSKFSLPLIQPVFDSWVHLGMLLKPQVLLLDPRRNDLRLGSTFAINFLEGTHTASK